MANVEVRKVETEYGETGVGVSNRTDVTYELGAEINGAWVKFASVPGNTVDSLVTRQQSLQQSQPAQQSQPTTMAPGTTPVPAAQQQAVDASAQQQRSGEQAPTETEQV